MNYITEARRLSVPINEAWDISDDDVLTNYSSNPLRADGLCIEGCTWCRNFRKDVNAALQAEAEVEAERLATIDRSEENILSWLNEEEHAQQAMSDLIDHIDLLPSSDLKQSACDALALSIDLLRQVFRANLDAQQAAHDALVAREENAIGATKPTAPRNPFADLFTVTTADMDPDAAFLAEFPY